VTAAQLEDMKDTIVALVTIESFGIAGSTVATRTLDELRDTTARLVRDLARESSRRLRGP
jgi:hypothetical protein